LDVEKKVMAGIKNMAGAFDKNPSSVDRRRRAEVQSELSESVEKLNLLNKAVRKYKNLYIGESDEDDGKCNILQAKSPSSYLDNSSILFSSQNWSPLWPYAVYQVFASH
jgi:hypothetical protein